MKKIILFVLAILGTISFPAYSALTTKATLNKNLPAETLVYMRIPNLWGLFAGGKKSTLHEAVVHQENQRYVTKLKAAFEKNILPDTHAIAGPALDLLLKHFKSPLEIAVLRQADTPSFVPILLITATLNVKSNDALNTIIDEIAQMSPMEVTQSIDSDGIGAWKLKKGNAFIQFNDQSGLMHIVVSSALGKAQFETVLSSIKPNKKNNIRHMEKKIDSSGYGLFMAADVEKLAPIMESMMPPAKLTQLKQMGLMETRAIAAGWGVSNKKGRLKFMVDAPDAAYRKMIPPVKTDLTVKSSGLPSFVFSLSLPLESIFKLYEQMALRPGSKDKKEFDKINASVIEATGNSIVDILALLSNEMVFFGDKVGEFLAIRIDDMGKFQSIIQKLDKRFGLNYEMVTRRGNKISHIAIPSIQIPTSKRSSEAAKNLMLNIYNRNRTHIYWIEEKNYLILADVPQSFYDRAAYKKKFTIKKWLKVRQRQKVEGSLLMLSVVTKDTPRMMYYVYLNVIEILADLTQADLDIYDFPSAIDLTLPKRGTFGVQLDYSKDILGFELVFEHNPFEVLTQAGPMVAIATVGIVAAIAIPAYQDYERRARRQNRQK